jgi:hypothetical protein
MDMFPARQNELEEKIVQWTKSAPELFKLHHVDAYTGHQVYAIAVSDFSVPDTDKKVHYFSQPHAHEPATTAAMINVIEELLTGKDLYSNATSLDLEKVLKETILIFNPIGNPSGRDRAPVDCWDGSFCDNNRFWCWMRGEHPEKPGQMWERIGDWDIRDYNAPDPLGIVYEQIGEFRYCEPNRCHDSSYFKLLFAMDKLYGFDAILDLHQCEFVDSDKNCMILLPPEACMGSPEVAARKTAWGQAVCRDWAVDKDLNPIIEPESLSYTGIQGQYFLDNWGELHSRMDILNTEIKNNSPEMTPALQLKAEAIAIRTSIRYLLEN